MSFALTSELEGGVGTPRGLAELQICGFDDVSTPCIVYVHILFWALRTTVQDVEGQPVDHALEHEEVQLTLLCEVKISV